MRRPEHIFICIWNLFFSFRKEKKGLKTKEKRRGKKSNKSHGNKACSKQMNVELILASAIKIQLAYKLKIFLYSFRFVRIQFTIAITCSHWTLFERSIIGVLLRLFCFTFACATHNKLSFVKCYRICGFQRHWNFP